MLRQFENITLKNPDLTMLPTGKEKQVLQLLSMGFSVKEVARETNNPRHTINEHLKNIRKKYGYRTTTQAVYDFGKKGEI